MEKGRRLKCSDSENRSPEFNCFKCGKVYQQMASLSRHKRNECGGVKSFSCSECGKQFPRKDSLKRHRLNCAGPITKPKKCHNCEKEFLTNWHLTRHWKQSNCLNSTTCKVCRKKISDSNNHVCPVLVRIPIKRKLNHKEAEDSSYIIPENLQDLQELALVFHLANEVPDNEVPDNEVLNDKVLPDDLLQTPTTDHSSIDFVIEVLILNTYLTLPCYKFHVILENIS